MRTADVATPLNLESEYLHDDIALKLITYRLRYFDARIAICITSEICMVACHRYLTCWELKWFQDLQCLKVCVNSM